MRGPLLAVVLGITTGGLFGGTGGAVGGLLVSLGVIAAVAAAAATWAIRVGRLLEPEEAYRLAPRPPLFGDLCDAVYRRTLGLQ